MQTLPAIKQAQTPALTGQLSSEAARLIGKSLRPASVRAYAAALRRWDEFNGLPVVDGAVISAQAAHLISTVRVCDFLAWLHSEHQTGPSGLRSAMAALRLVAAAHNPGSDFLTDGGRKLCQQVIAGVLADRADSGLINAATGKAAMMADQLRLAALACGGDLAGKRDRALLLIGFSGGFRRSELAALQLDHVQRVEAGLLVTLPRSKSNKTGQRLEQKLIFKGSTPATCPVVALDTWLHAAGIRSGYIFRRVFKGGNKIGAPLCDRSVCRIVQARGAAVGICADDLGGHSLRAGFVSSALQAGSTSRQIMAQTGHQTAAMIAVYDRRLIDESNRAGRGLL